MITRTIINTPEQITFCNSPINIVVNDPDIVSAQILIWVWNGDLNKTLPASNYTLEKTKVSSEDTYIAFEISKYIKSFLIAPPNAANTSQPTFVYNELANATITGQAVFWQIQVIKTTTTGNTLINTFTNVATLGYKWNNEQTFISTHSIDAGGSLGFDVARNKYYNPKIHNYINQSFDLTKTLIDCTSANVIKVENTTIPEAFKRCSLEPILIVYLNKVGLFEMFTTHGKVSISSKVDSDISPRLYRNPNLVDNSFMHSSVRDISKVTQSYSINTGHLKSDMVGQIEEIIYSPKIYLIRFKGDFNPTSLAGTTIDSTYITIDTLNTTIDGLTVTDSYLGDFKSHIQTPVICTGSDFQRKTRLNDKKDIDYNLMFEETTNKINDIR